MPRFAGCRQFANEVEVKNDKNTSIDIDSINKKLGVDTVFSQQKHAYVLTFPWNFPEIITDFENDTKGINEKGAMILAKVGLKGFWHSFIFNNATYEMNKLFREFHQSCALPDYYKFDQICEGKLAQYM